MAQKWRNFEIIKTVLTGFSHGCTDNCTLAYGGAEEPPPPSEGICYKVFYEANFNELIKLRPHDYSSKISSCIASTVISDMKYFKCECKKVEDAKFCQQVVAKKGTFKNVEMYAAAVAYHCEKMSRL